MKKSLFQKLISSTCHVSMQVWDMDDDSKKLAGGSNAAASIPDVTVEAAAVAMSEAAAAEWSPSPSPTAVSSSDEEEDEDDDTLPQDDLAFARAVARHGLTQ